MDKKVELTNTVRKSNVLNEMRNSSTSTTEYRLFCVFLSQFKMDPINKKEIERAEKIGETVDPIYDNTVTFSLSDYAKLMNLDRPRRTDIEKQAKYLVSRTARIDNVETGGFSTVSLFTKFTLEKKENNNWYVSLKANEDIAPEFRQEKGNFLRYKLYNTVFLKSYNQQRIYEILKQYENIGERVVSLKDLREYLSIKENEYKKWGDFSQKVIKVAQKEIKKYTDICFDFEVIKEKTKVVAVKFIIKKNDGYKDFLNVEQYIKNKEIKYVGESIKVENQLNYEENENKIEENESDFFNEKEITHSVDAALELSDFASIDYFKRVNDSLFQDEKRKIETIEQAVDYLKEIIPENFKEKQIKNIIKEAEKHFESPSYNQLIDYIEEKIDYVSRRKYDELYAYLITAVKNDY